VTFVLDSVVYWRFSLGMEAWMPVFAAAFRANGLPHAIRCDNGAPFGSTGAGGPYEVVGLVA
jgi:hypothetical protein